VASPNPALGRRLAREAALADPARSLSLSLKARHASGSRDELVPRPDPFTQSAAPAVRLRPPDTLLGMGQRTAGDLMFEAYLRDRGIEAPDHEPDLGAVKKPDYFLKCAGAGCVCEVKEFARNTDSLPTSSQADGSWSMQTVLRPIRSQIREAARQLKPFAGAGLPLVIVLTNPHRAPVIHGSQEIIWAMYGDPVVRVPASNGIASARGGAIFTVDRNGKLRGDHAYVSAVAVVRRNSLAMDIPAPRTKSTEGGRRLRGPNGMRVMASCGEVRGHGQASCR
jgi:hypothetical protein